MSPDGGSVAISANVRIALFDQPRVLASDGTIEYPLPRKTLNVLAYLILNRKRAIKRDTIAFALFPDDEEETARGALRRNLSYLLTTLPDGRRFIDADSERIAWKSDAPADVDVLAFEQAVDDGRDADAIAEYAGQLLPTIYDEWTTAARERLRDAFHAALSRSIAADRSRRDFDAATATAHRLLDDDPWREDIVRRLMSIRYEAGDRAGALSAFDRFAALLRTKMQTEPMPETFALRDALLRGAHLPTSEPPRAIRAERVAAEPGLPFVGRDAAMKRAHSAWQSAADGRAGVLFVSGEAGVGKSRFTTELVRLAEREGGFIARGYTASGGEQQPYEAFVDAFTGTPALSGEHAGVVLSDDRAARLRFFDSVRARLSEMSRARPLVLVLEDLHWAGASTIELLEFVTRRLERTPVLIVATARSDELARAHPLRALRRELQRAGLATDVALDRLDVDDAMRAARAALPAGVDEAALARVLAWVDGVPLLLFEAVRDLAAGRTSTASSMTTLVAERFARLSSAAETALVFGAVLGERFDLGTLVAATAWRDDQILDALSESIECGFVRAAVRSPDLAFEFTHDLVRVAALARISEPDLTRTHGLIARAIRAQDPAGGARARQIARHFAAAGEHLRAAEYFRNAARYALDVFANEDARESATAGLELCDSAQTALRTSLLDLREQSLARIGATALRRVDAHELVALADGDEARAIALGRLFGAYATDAVGRKGALDQLGLLAGTSDVTARTHADVAARHAYFEGEYAFARESALRAADAFEDAGDRRAAMKARFIGINSLTRLGSFAQGEAEVDALRPIVDASDDEVLRAEFYLVASAAQGETHREAALEDARRSLELALRTGDRFGEARARHNVAVIAGKLRRYEEALDEHERALAAYHDVGDAPGIRDARLNIAGVRIFCGDYERPRRLLDEVEVAEEPTPWLALRCQLIRGALASRMERVDEAERHLRDALRRAGELGTGLYRARCEFELAKLLASNGRPAEAATSIESALTAYATMGAPDLEVEAFALAARLRASLGDAAGARERAQLAAARATKTRLQSHSEIVWNLAATYALIGDTDAAERFARDAAAAGIDDALRMPADLAEAYLQLRWHREAIDYVWGRPVPVRYEPAAAAAKAPRAPRRP